MKPRTRKEREVWHALGSLLEQGFRPDDMTGEIIGDRLLELGYNRGSNSDIYRFKRTWLIAQNGEVEGESTSKNHLQITLSDPITQAAKLLQEKLKGEAEQEINKIKHEADGKLSHAKNTIDKLELNLSKATEQNELLQQQLDQLKKEKKDLSKSLQHEITEHHGTKQREVTLRDQVKVMQRDYETSITNLKSMHKENVDHLKQQISACLSNHKAEISDYKIVLENQRQQYSLQLDDLKIKNEKLNQALSECQDKIKENDFNLKSKDNEIDRLKSELMMLKKDHKVISSQLEEAKRDYFDKLADKEKQLLLTQGRLEQCIQDLEKFEEKTNRLRTELLVSKEKIKTLGSKYKYEYECKG